MNCGQSCNPSCLPTSTPIALVEDDHAYPIETVQTRSSTCCERGVNGKPLTRQSSAPIRQHMTASSNGYRRESFSGCGKQDWSTLKSSEALTGTGFQWMEP